MIHFYQKGIIAMNATASSDTWINEMCSLTTEDFVANKLQIDGPRGVDYSDATAGSSGNTYGRLPRYNYYNDIPVTQWGAYVNTLVSYSAAYSFGAYLARNYGGVELFNNIVTNSEIDSTAITAALADGGYSETFESALYKWAAANLVSDNTSAPAGYRYNTGGWIDSSIGGTTYNLGSINLYNYYYSAMNQTGPYFYTSSPVGNYGVSMPSSCIFYYRVGSDLTGTVSRNISFVDDMAVTIVVKDD
jgi:hypothetical protein